MLIRLVINGASNYWHSLLSHNRVLRSIAR